jgi:hypothetical protein
MAEDMGLRFMTQHRLLNPPGQPVTQTSSQYCDGD